VHAQETASEPGFEFGQGFVQHVVTGCRAQRDVLQLSLQVEHPGQRQAQHAAAVADHQQRRFVSGRPQRPRPAGDAFQRGLQALAPHGLGQVVGGRNLEGRQRVFGMRGDEDHGRRQRQVLQRRRQLQAAAARQVDVEQHDINGRVFQECRCRAGIGSFAQHHGTRHSQRLNQAAQAQPGQRFVVHQQHTQRCSHG
jgi:hypothetical protein